MPAQWTASIREKTQSTKMAARGSNRSTSSSLTLSSASTAAPAYQSVQFLRSSRWTTFPRSGTPISRRTPTTSKEASSSRTNTAQHSYQPQPMPLHQSIAISFVADRAVCHDSGLHYEEARVHAGLRANCLFARVIRSDCGTVFYQSYKSFEDSRFSKYPRLPVRFAKHGRHQIKEQSKGRRNHGRDNCLDFEKQGSRDLVNSFRRDRL